MLLELCFVLPALSTFSSTIPTIYFTYIYRILNNKKRGRGKVIYEPTYYSKLNASDLPCVIGNERFAIIGEIGRGSYARILKAHVVQKPAKLVALKQQKPACLWEYYISEQIRRRLNPSKVRIRVRELPRTARIR